MVDLIASYRLARREMDTAATGEGLVLLQFGDKIEQAKSRGLRRGRLKVQWVIHRLAQHLIATADPDDFTARVGKPGERPKNSLSRRNCRSPITFLEPGRITASGCPRSAALSTTRRWTSGSARKGSRSVKLEIWGRLINDYLHMGAIRNRAVIDARP